MRTRTAKSWRQSILDMIKTSFETQPERVRSCFPELAQELEKYFPSRRKNSYRSSLTEPERERLLRALKELLSKGDLSREQAGQTLEYCATLVQDGTLPIDVERKVLLTLLHQLVGTALSSMKRMTRFEVGSGEVAKEVAILRGVHLHLTWNDRLVAISVSPAKFKERSKALKFVGIAKDAAPDVALHHDVYLAEVFGDASR